MTRAGLLGTCAAVIIVGGAVVLFVDDPADRVDPAQWQQRRGHIADFQRHYEASLTEIGGLNTLVVDCSNNATFGVYREPPFDPDAPTRITYRIDSGRAVAEPGQYNGSYVWFDSGASGAGNPLVRGILHAQRLTVHVAPSRGGAFVLRFDVSRAAPALERLQADCHRG